MSETLPGATSRVRWALELAGELVRRPALLPTAVRQLGRVAPTGWYRRAPFLPVPAADYLEFRQVTSTGNADGLPAVDEIVLWLEWCRSFGSR